MKKVSLFALLVLAGMLFIVPSLKAQEAEAEVAPAAEAAPAQDAEAQKKAQALAVAEDDDQTGNFMTSTDENLIAFIDAIFEQFNTDGGDFDTGNPVNNTSHTYKGDDEEEGGDEPAPRPVSRRSSRW